jgi:hypothetical protein
LGYIAWAVSACGGPHADIDPNYFATAKEMQKQVVVYARLCMKDAATIPLEHNGNCVAVPKYLATRKPVCAINNDRAPMCKSLTDGDHDIMDMYWRAIGISASRGQGPEGFRYFFDAEAMSRDFGGCARSKDKNTRCVAVGEDVGGWTG